MRNVRSLNVEPEAGLVAEIGTGVDASHLLLGGNMYASEVMRRSRRRDLMRKSNFSAVRRTSCEDNAHVRSIFEGMLLRTVLAQPVVANPMGVDPAASAYSKAVEPTFTSPKGSLAFRICAL